LIFSEYFLGYWANQTRIEQLEKGDQNVLIYSGLVVSTVVIAIVRAEAFFFACLKSTKKLFEQMLKCVIRYFSDLTKRAPMQFFETQSQGRLLNRFLKDVAIIDEMIPTTMFDLIQGLFQLMGSAGKTIK
jgi:ABC-type multidrug transport system fused ATPase/permease subunit